MTRHVWADARERTDMNRKTPWGKAVYKRRKETVERSFADAKQLHGTELILSTANARPPRCLQVLKPRQRPPEAAPC
jgi:hypothetical protein